MYLKDQSKETPLNLAVDYVYQKMKKEDQFLENGFISFQKLRSLHKEDNLEMELNFNSKIKQNQNLLELAKKEIKEFLSLKNSQLIGFGLQSYVFSSVDHNMNRYAIKCFNIYQNNSEEIDPEKLKKAEFEAQVLLSNRNQNVVYCFKSVKGNQFYLIQLEQCIGTLSEQKEQIGYLSEKQFIQYFIDLMKGLQFTQSNKMINRDLKPDNILIGFDGRLKLSDFGLSYQLKSFSTKYASSIEGNCYHFAPELMDENIKKMIQNQQQFESKQTLKTDCFAAGLIMLNLIGNHSDFNYYHLLHQEEYVKNMQFNWLGHFKMKDPIVFMLKSLLAFYPWQRAGPEQILQQFENLMNQNPQNSVLKSQFYFDPLSQQEYQKLKQIKCGNFIPIDQQSYYLLPFKYIYSLAQRKYHQNQVQQWYQQQHNNDNQNQVQNQIQSFQQQINQIKGQIVNFSQMNQFCQRINQKVENLTKQTEQNLLKFEQLEKQFLSQTQKNTNCLDQFYQKIQQQINQFSNNFIDVQTYNSNFQYLKQDFEKLRQQLSDNFLTVNNEIQELKQQYNQQLQQISYLHQAVQATNMNNCQNNTNQQQKVDSNKKQEKAVTIINQNQENFTPNQQYQEQQNQNYYSYQQQQHFQAYQQQQNYNQNQKNSNEFNFIQQKEQSITQQQQYQQQQQQSPQQIQNFNQANQNEYILGQQQQFQITQQQQQYQQQQQQQQQQVLYFQNQNQMNYPYDQQQQQYQITPQQQNQQFYNQNQVNSNENIFNQQKQFAVTQQQQATQQFQNQNQIYQNENLSNQQKQFSVTQQQQATQQFQNQNQVQQNENLSNYQKQFSVTEQYQQTQQIQYKNQSNQNYANQDQQNQFQITQQHQPIQQNLNQNQQNLNKGAQEQQKQFSQQQEEQKQNQDNKKPPFKNYSLQQQLYDKEDQSQQPLFQSLPLKVKELDYFQQLDDITSQVKKFFNSINQNIITQFTKETILQSYLKVSNLNDTHIFIQGLQYPQNVKTPEEKDEYQQIIIKNDDLTNNCKFIKVIKLFNKNFYIQYGINKNLNNQNIQQDQYNQFLVLFEQIKKLQQQQQNN